MDDRPCIFCGISLNDGQPTSVLRQKGCETINRCSLERNDSLSVEPGQSVHKECRRVYCHPRTLNTKIDSTPGPSEHVSLRSSITNFSFRRDCFYCGEKITEDEKKRKIVSYVMTKGAQDTVLSDCASRDGDWAECVRARILHVFDLPAADAMYHQTCSTRFRTQKSNPVDKPQVGRPSKQSRKGRPLDEEQECAFLKVAQYLMDNDDETQTVSELTTKMTEFLDGDSCKTYSEKHMKRKLKEHFGDDVILTTINGKANVATMRHSAERILLDFHDHQSKGSENEKMKIIEAASKLIREEIKAMDTVYLTYPRTDQLENVDTALAYLPASLKMLLQGITSCKDGVKVASLGQAIIQVTRPRVILAPLQIGLAIEMHHHFSSRFLVDSLHKHGFCASYQEVQRFERSAAVHQGTDIPHNNNEFVQYACDNVDHNIRTIDGHNTFHGMGMISMVTPGSNLSQDVPRVRVSPQEISGTGHVKIHYYKEDHRALAELTYDSILLINAADPTTHLDILWQSALLFDASRPAWAGTMQFVHDDAHPGKTAVLFLPMIDMSANDPTCIFSAMTYIAEHAKRHSITPIITFDQPLYWKALSILLAQPQESPLRAIVLRLGGFHLLMSFLGSIGHLMAGSGLTDILQLIYAQQAVEHMMSGKAVSRAVRGHLLLFGTLSSVLLAKSPNLPLPLSHDAATDDQQICELQQLYNSLMKKEKAVSDVCSSEVLVRIQEILIEKKSTMTDRTAKLWVQYLEMVQLLMNFIRAERTGNWSLHLQTVSQMLPYLAASGHSLYTKSARIYLQLMKQLENDYPDVHEKFSDGFHVARRSNRSWAGLSTDLMIEQVLMRSLKTSGGLTRGRGMTEQQRLIWLLSMPACSEVNRAMQDLTGMQFNSGEQNKEMGKSRKTRDITDVSTLFVALSDRDPFDCEASATLKNIMTGTHASKEVNVDEAKLVGERILNEMTGQSVTKYSFKRNNQAVTMASKSAVKIGNDQVQVNPHLLFQRLVVAAKVSENTAYMFSYELCSHPPALFEETHVMREAQKSVLAEALWSKHPTDDYNIDGAQYVLDGGALLHRIPWPNGVPTYRELCLLYCDYVTRKYGSAIMVFDGYSSPSTKDMTHRRRHKRVGAEVTFNDKMKVLQKKDIFLSNTKNKEKFIMMLSEYLSISGSQAVTAEGDADVLIVQTATRSASQKKTILVGDDTDLLVLLLYHTDQNAHDLFLQSQTKSKIRTWNIKALRESLGESVCQDIMFIHGILGCDTTSRIYGFGKGASLKKYLNSQHFRDQAKPFRGSDDAEAIIAAGEQALVSLYGGKHGESLDDIRYKKFCEKVSTKSSHVLSQSIPPTRAAAKYHSMRIYLQVQQWKGVQGINPQDWGWCLSEGTFVPVMTDLQPAPEALLKIIRCNCATDCSSARCSCRKNNLECSLACGHCRGSSCSNSVMVDNDSDNDSDVSDNECDDA